MKNIYKLLIVFISFFITKQNIYAQAGTLDPTFGDGGLVVENSVNGYGQSIKQSDGKILIIGNNAGITVDRFNPDGSYDESFGLNGRFSVDLNGKLSGPQYKTFALLDDGRIVCAALYLPKGVTGKIDVGVVRINANGTQDSSFGINGLDTLELDNITRATGLVVQPDGKIVISGDVQKNEYNEQRTFICRFMPDGGLDPTFGEGGIVVTTYVNATNSNSLVMNSSGKLIRGCNYDIYDEHSAYMLESFNPDGTKDAGFGENGVAKFYFGFGQSGDWFTKMEGASIQDDGRIICIGESGKNNIDMAICRFNVDGTIDQNFGEDGSLIVPYKNHLKVVILGSAIQPDGKILTVGAGGDDPFGALILVRYLNNGQLDPEFGNNGITSIINDTASMGASSIFYLPDGKILTTGRIIPIGPRAYTLLARFNNDPILAANFKEIKAAQNNDAITITWQTLTESGTKSFTVERSMNASDYVGINTVPAKGVASNYSYTDKNPLDGISYYRIRENAANGTNTFSPVVKVVFNDNGVISLYPNPAKNTVTVKGLNKNINAVIKITDMQGREISSQNFTQSSSATLNIRALAQGTYFVQVAQEGKVVRLKLIKE